MNMMRKFGILLALGATFALTACGGSGEGSFAGGSSSGSTSSGAGSSSSSSSSGAAVSQVSSITLVSSSSTMPSDGSAPATITAYVLDSNQQLLSGINVAFTATSGGVAPSSVASNASGQALATLTTAGDATLRTITVTAKAGSKQATVQVQVVNASSSSTVQMGTGTGAQFMPNVIGVSSASLSAGGSTTLSVTLQQSDGTLYTQATTITFSSPCIASNESAIYPNGSQTPNAMVQTSTGEATVTYTAKGCAGSDVITASATVGTGGASTSVSASATVTVAQAAVGSIVFVSANPTNIGLAGMGSTGRPVSSTVIFQVLDTAGSPRQGATVNFSLNTTVGNITLSTPSTTSDANGNAQVVVGSGTVATAVRVTASTTLANNTVVSTQSNVLTITTGIPTSNNFSLSLQCGNIEGWAHDGVTTQLQVILSDRFQNPVPDGTAVTFHAKTGDVVAQCTTATVTSGSKTQAGTCGVTFTSAGIRPTGKNGAGYSIAGLVPVLATAIGEESFNDAFGDGNFHPTDTFSNIGDAFENDAWLFTTAVPPAPLYSATDSSGADWFYDFLDTKTYANPDGVFHGYVNPTFCPASTAVCAGPYSWGIGEQGTIIYSDSTANITNTSGGALTLGPLTAGANGSITVWVYDLNGNPMPGQSSITVSATGSSALTIAAPATQTVPCVNVGPGYYPGQQIANLTLFTFSFTVPTTAGSGIMTIAVSTPGPSVNGLGTTTTYATVPYTVP